MAGESEKKKNQHVFSPQNPQLSFYNWSGFAFHLPSPKFVQAAPSSWEWYGRDVIERQEISDVADFHGFPTQDLIQANTKTPF